MKTIRQFILEEMLAEQSTEEIAKNLATALVYDKQWYAPKFNKDNYFLWTYHSNGIRYKFGMQEFCNGKDFVKITEPIYNKALGIVQKDFHIGVTKEDAGDYNIIMPICICDTVNRMGAGDAWKAYDVSELKRFTIDLDRKEYPEVRCCHIVADYVPSKYKKYALFSNVSEHPSKSFKYPKHDINKKEIMYTWLKSDDKNSDWYIKTPDNKWEKVDITEFMKKQ